MRSILALCMLVGLTLANCPANYAINDLRAGTSTQIQITWAFKSTPDQAPRKHTITHLQIVLARTPLWQSVSIYLDSCAGL